MRPFILMSLAALSACSWFGSKTPRPPDPSEFIVTGAPAGSLVFIDGVQAAPAAAIVDHPQVIDAAVGSHRVEIHLNGKVVYREETYVGVGEHRVVAVLSGAAR